MWECGLKPYPVCETGTTLNVTPHVGVWIETENYEQMLQQEYVTPHVGVWIETSQGILIYPM